MRLVVWGVLAALAAGGSGAPASKAELDELARLDAELRQLQMKQALFAAVKPARRLYQLQRKISGDGADDTQRRKEVLAIMLHGAGDYAEALALFQELLRDAERDKGADSREAMRFVVQES